MEGVCLIFGGRRCCQKKSVRMGEWENVLSSNFPSFFQGGVARNTKLRSYSNPFSGTGWLVSYSSNLARIANPRHLTDFLCVLCVKPLRSLRLMVFLFLTTDYTENTEKNTDLVPD
jgi:hypothetical protein